MIRTYLKNLLIFNVGAEFKILGILEYAGGLKRRLILNTNSLVLR